MEGWVKPKEQASRDAEEVVSLRKQLDAHSSEKTAVEQQVRAAFVPPGRLRSLGVHAVPSAQ